MLIEERYNATLSHSYSPLSESWITIGIQHISIKTQFINFNLYTFQLSRQMLLLFAYTPRMHDGNS